MKLTRVFKTKAGIAIITITIFLIICIPISMMTSANNGESDEISVTGYVSGTASGLWCRASAGGDSIGLFAEGTTLTVVGNAVDGWYHVRGKGTSGADLDGWSYGGYITIAGAFADTMKSVYISPSRQTANLYAYGDTTEGEQMGIIGDAVRQNLENAGFTVYLGSPDTDIMARVSEANRIGVDAYVAIHSNAGGSGGTEAFYNQNVYGSEKLATCIYDRIAAITPTKDRGMFTGDTMSLYEVLYPTMPSCLVEVEFHDNEYGAQWIMYNRNAIADEITVSINDYFSGQ